MSIYDEIKTERTRQDSKWSEQNHEICHAPGSAWRQGDANLARRMCDHRAQENTMTDGALTWEYILKEEIAEVYAESDPAKQREELIQVAAVVVAMIECLDRRTKKENP